MKDALQLTPRLIAYLAVLTLGAKTQIEKLFLST